MSVRISLRGMLRLIWIDFLRKVQNVGFLVERLKYIYRKKEREKVREIEKEKEGGDRERVTERVRERKRVDRERRVR